MTDAPGLLDRATTIAALQTELDRTVALAHAAPADLDIPTCPEWDAAGLFIHLGTIHRWVATILGQLPQERISRRAIDVEPPTDDRWGPWMADGAEQLSTVIARTDPEAPVWSWGGDPHARWWTRRMLHETAVHNADVALALDEGFGIDPFVAADGICELLDNTAERLKWPDATPPASDSTVHLHATDTRDDSHNGDSGDTAGNGGRAAPTGRESLLGESGEWMVTMADGTVSHTHGHGKGDSAVRGPVTELMLVLNRRLDVEPSGVDTFGDEQPLRSLLRAVRN